MKSSRHRIALSVALLIDGVFGDVALARADHPAGSIGAYFDAEGVTTELRGIEAFELFDMWILAFDPPGGMDSFEFYVEVPAGVVATRGHVLCPTCTDLDARGGGASKWYASDNYIVSTGGVCFTDPGTWTLVQYAACLSLSLVNDGRFCISGSTPSSFPTLLPGYSTCGPAWELRAFSPAYTGCAILNPATVPVAPTAWGSLKARFSPAGG